MQANSDAASTQCGSTRMQIYLNHFGLLAINEKLQSRGVNNLDRMAHDWYNDYDDDIIAQKE